MKRQLTSSQDAAEQASAELRSTLEKLHTATVTGEQRGNKVMQLEGRFAQYEKQLKAAEESGRKLSEQLQRDKDDYTTAGDPLGCWKMYPSRRRSGAVVTALAWT